MKNFLDDHFLLENETARTLYHEYALDMPIFDYHNHLIPGQIAEDRKFENLYEIWLSGDHYKWRAMRSFGIDERYITGDADPREKFQKYAEMIPYTIGNPLYHWTHLELRRYFDIETLLSGETAEEIWQESAALLRDKQMGARYFLEVSNVKVLCTTDDPADSLEHHKAIAADDTIGIKVLPTFRPDKALALGDRNAYLDYLRELGRSAAVEIDGYPRLIEALEKRHSAFRELGARISDHALTLPIFAEADRAEVNNLYSLFLAGSRDLSEGEIEKIQTSLLIEISRMNRERGWAMQLHLGALRNNNSRMFRALGPDTGYDSIADGPVAAKLSSLLNAMEEAGGLPKTILYNLNPSDNYVIGTMIGNFQDGKIAGKIQFGTGWWFNDQRDGMEAQMKALANLGLLSKFVGMLTDSRSFLSFPRHEYFRRILCNLIGTWVENGEYPRDMKLLGGIVQDICYRNAEGYFDVSAPAAAPSA
jgi:glucuronate isomerase